MESTNHVRTHNQQLGAWGEDRVARWYRKSGYRILDRNWRHGRQGEIDVIAERRGQVVFCEVKTRSSLRFGAPIEAVTPDKAMRIRRLSMHWLDEHAVHARSTRFDVASVVGAQLEVFEGVF